MNGIRHARLIRFLLIYLIYGRVFILSLFPVWGIMFVLKLDPKYFAYSLLCFAVGFLLPTAVFFALSFIPKCPLCGKRIAIVPFRGRHANFPGRKGFGESWFGEAWRYLRSGIVPCHHCGEEVRLMESNDPQPTQPLRRSGPNALEEPKMRKTSLIATAVATALGAAIGSLVVNNLFKAGGEKVTFDRALVRTADELNKTLPMMVDADTRLDSTAAQPGKKFTYHYTFVNYSKEALNIDVLKQVLRPKLIANYRSSPQMKQFRENDAELHYYYKDKSGEFLFVLVVTPQDF